MYFVTGEECYGSWQTPEGCTDDCKYQAEWCANGDEVSFIVKASTGRRRSVGIGFSMDNMTVRARAINHSIAACIVHVICKAGMFSLAWPDL